MWVKIISLGIFIVNLASKSDSATFTYGRNYDIYNDENWENNNAQRECNGLILPEHIMGVITAKKLEIKQLTFGSDTTFFFDDNTVITFNEYSHSIMNCVILNSTTMIPRYWNDIQNWLIEGKEDNEAVPHLERLPCQYDDVVFPKGVTTGRVLIEGSVTVKSLKFGTEQWTNEDFLEHETDAILSETLTDLSEGINIRNVACSDESGCECGNKIAYRNYCKYIPSVENFDCLNPIEAFGFCNKICGAAIIFVPSKSFKIADIEERLRKYAAQTHVSKVLNNDGEYVEQIIFTEKQFSGSSLEEAEDLHKELLKDKIIYRHNSEIRKSGYYFKKGGTTKTALSLVFGSLLGACLVFGLIFVVYGKERKFGNVGNRLGLGASPLTYRSIFFSRNMSVSEGAGLIMEGQSVAGSVTNIPKSFDNPMFSEIRKRSPSTSESSDSSVEASNDQAVKVDETPETFEDQERRVLIETVAEEGDLVDLSEIH